MVGDYTYSNGKNEFNIQGQMLHAKSLEFKHPITGKTNALGRLTIARILYGNFK